MWRLGVWVCMCASELRACTCHPTTFHLLLARCHPRVNTALLRSRPDLPLLARSPRIWALKLSPHGCSSALACATALDAGRPRWCGLAWGLGVVWCDARSACVGVGCGSVWAGMGWRELVWVGVGWKGLARGYGVGWCGMEWGGMGWCGLM